MNPPPDHPADMPTGRNAGQETAPTPRTDAVELSPRGWSTSEVFSLARTLERELLAATKPDASDGADRRRLDWLEKKPAMVSLESEDEATVPMWVCFTPKGDCGDWSQTGTGASIRECIDAAIEQSGAQRKGDT